MSRRNRNLCAITAALILLAVVGLAFPMVYYLNDDVMIQSVLSGAYTGVPNGHGVYMKYPLTGMISLLYRIAGLPWLAVTMAGCFLLSLSAVFCRSLAIADRVGSDRKNKLCIAGGGMLLGAALFLPYFFYMHYTITAAVLGGSGLFLAVTEDTRAERTPAMEKGGWGQTLKDHALTVLLLTLCYNVRSQVFYLLLPFLGAALCWRLCRSCGRLKARMWREVLVLPLLLAGCVLACMGADAVMYRESGWKAYQAYNDSRTLLYDYLELPVFDENRELYEQLGITESRYHILDSYNTALDGAVDRELLQKTADAAREKREAGLDGFGYLKDCVKEYYYHLRYNEQPYKYLLVLGFLAVGILTIYNRQWYLLGLTFCLGAGRSAVWIWLIWKGRFPERISVSLYLLELMLLGGMLLTALPGAEGRKRVGTTWKAALKGCAVFLVCCLLLAVGGSRFRLNLSLAREQEDRLGEWEALLAYMEGEPEHTFLLDVYTMVPYGGLQWDTSHGGQNYLLAGGWMTGTPLMKQRLEALGAADGGEAMKENSSVYFVSDKDRDVSWLEAYLCERFGVCELAPAGQVAVDGTGKFMVYKVKEQGI